MAKPKGRRPASNAWLDAGVQRGSIFMRPATLPVTIPGAGGSARKRVLVAPGRTILDARGHLRMLPSNPVRMARVIDGVTRKLEAQEEAAARAEAAKAKPKLPHAVTDTQLFRVLAVLGYTRTSPAGGFLFTHPSRQPIRFSHSRSSREISFRTTKFRWVAPLVREFLERGHTL